MLKKSHPVILSYLCHANNFECDALDKYIENREDILKELGIDRDAGKQAYLSLTNGGSKDSRNIPNKTDHMASYKAEMKDLHTKFSKLYPERFKKVKEKRKKTKNDFNHKAAFMNTLLCDIENEILINIYDYLGSPSNAVLCFDGIMIRDIPSDEKISECKKFVYDKMGIRMDLKVKPFELALTLPENIPKYKYISVDYFDNYENLGTNEGEIRSKEIVDEWINNSLAKIRAGGKGYYVTRNLYVDDDPLHKEKIIQFKSVQFSSISQDINFECRIVNPSFTGDYKKLDDDEKKNISKIKPFLALTLSEYLNIQKSKRRIPSYSTLEYHPYLGSPPNLHGKFNTFPPFQMEKMKSNNINFEESKLFKHIKSEICNDNIGEFNHLMDHIADIIQDGFHIKPNAHFFYSKQGCGKGLLANFVSLMIGSTNVVTIRDARRYFDNSFNSESCFKLLKVFEELSDKGAAYVHFDRLKDEITNQYEYLESKGFDRVRVRSCARYWFFTNHENSLYVEPDQRRYTLHKINPRYAKNRQYFRPIANEINDPKFIKAAFDWFANRVYSVDSVNEIFVNNYQKEQKLAHLPNGLKFIKEFIEENLEDTKYEKGDPFYRFKSSDLVKQFFDKYGGRRTTLVTQLKNIGLNIVQKKLKGGYTTSVYEIFPPDIEIKFQELLEDPSFKFDYGESNNVGYHSLEPNLPIFDE